MSYPPPGQPYPGQPYGQPYPGYSNLPSRQPTSGLAVGSLVCSLIVCCIPVTSVVGVILGFCALPGINSGKAKGKGVAYAGIVIGLLGLLVLTPLVGLGTYRVYSKFKSTIAKPAETYVAAVCNNDLDTAVAYSTPAWTREDSEDLARQLTSHGKLTGTSIQHFQIAQGSNQQGTFVIHLNLSFSDGKDVVVTFHLQPQNGAQSPDKAFLVEKAQVLP